MRIEQEIEKGIMKIKYVEADKSIIIDDHLKWQYFLLYATVILTLINSILYSLGSFSDNQTITWIWFIIGILSLVTLIYGVLKKTTVEKIRVHDIIALKQKNIFGQSRYSLKLGNGKLRDLPGLKTQRDKQETKKLFEQIGVKAIL